MFGWSPLPRSAAATFRDAVSDKHNVRVSAIADLVRWAKADERERCIEQLLRMLQSDSDVEVRAAAALALADVEAVEGLPALIAAADHGAPRLRQMALIAIGELAAPGQAEALASVRRALRSALPALEFQALVAANRLFADTELLAALLPALREGEPRLRYVACRIAEERFFSNAGLPTPDELVRELNARLADSEPHVALAAAVVLGRAGSEEAQALVVRALNERKAFSELDDEQAAIELCADLGLDAARPGLRARAFGGVLSKSPLAFQALVALARLGDEPARESILRGLSSMRRSVRDRAVAAAGQARLEAARQRLLELEGDERGADQGSVLEALAALNR